MKELNKEKKVLTGEELEKVNGGSGWPVKYELDPLSQPYIVLDDLPDSPSSEPSEP